MAYNPTALETHVPLSQSVIWRLQREFYVQRGIKAWTEDLVPQFITNNPFIAEIYAGIVFNFLTDCGDVSTTKPIRIFELGAGVGKFSWLFLRKLTDLLRNKDIAPGTIRYCMTDCSENVIQEWRSNKYLAEFVSSGILVFERFQVGDEIHSDFLSASAGSLVLTANYVFDSLPQDAFEIKGGQIFETLVSTVEPEPGGNKMLSGLQLAYKNVTLRPQRYSDDSWNKILDGYRSRLDTGLVLFPCAALEALEEFHKFSDGRILILIGDKGFAHEEDLALCQGPPTIEFHGPNCFSQMVNLDAIGKYIQASGGTALLPEKHSAGLNICAFLHRRPGDEFAATRTAYGEAQVAFDPDDLFTLFAWLNAHMEEMTLRQILAALRLTRWDPIFLQRVFLVLARQLRTVGLERYDLRDSVLKTWANHYPVNQDENAFAFQCGVILLELRFFEEALSMFKVSQQILGPSAPTSYNLGLCQLGLGSASKALAFMIEACKLDPTFEPAKTTRHKLEGQNVQC